jgi:hypothetical protein
MYPHILFTASGMDASVTPEADVAISLLNDKGQNYAYHAVTKSFQKLIQYNVQNI